MKQTNWAWALGLAALATVAVTAQKQGQAQQAPPRPAPSLSPLFRTTTDAVSVDVVVRTATGQFMPDLKLDEFEVLEDGVPQTIQSLSMSNGGRFLNLLIPQMKAAATDGIIMPSSRPPQDVSGRLFIFFIDDANIEAIETPELRNVLRRIVKTLFHEGDLIAMVSSGMSSVEVNQTYDLKRIDQEISKIAGSAMSPHDIIQAAQAPDGPSGLRYQANNAFRTALDMLAQMGAITGKRKSFIWVSCGYDFNPFQASRDEYASYFTGGDPSNSDFGGVDASQRAAAANAYKSMPASNPFLSQGIAFSEADLNLELVLLAQAANRANATFYAVDPRGLTTDMANLGDKFADVSEWRDYLHNTKTSLMTLSELTGGFAITNTNEFEKALKRIDGETSDYYILGYTSNNPDPLKTVRKIDVQVRRPGAVVTNWRRSYTLIPPSLIKK